MEIFTLLTPCSVQGCVQGGNNLVNTMELATFSTLLQGSKHLVPLIKFVLRYVALQWLLHR